MDLLQAERALAVCAEEVRVFVLDGTVAVVTADGILQRPRAIVDDMDKAVEKEEGQCSRDGGLVEVRQIALQVGHRHSLVAARHLAQNQQTRRRGPYLPMFQLLGEISFISHHTAKLNNLPDIPKFKEDYLQKIIIAVR